ncbi:MAG: GAF domain-containing protein [Anaerolineaceae bacterium]|nr:GAF domain-containing protein [Anaerolineaceae bacterium]
MNTEENYKMLIRQAQALTEDERMVIPNLANTAALLGNNLPDINWAGYYLLTDDILILGPFWGQPACIRIPVGKGVCGTAVQEDRVQLVPDVHAFPGHIACDSRSRSEIVIPLHAGGRVAGVLDIDSPEPGRFDETDRKYLTEFAAVLERNCDWGK